MRSVLAFTAVLCAALQAAALDPQPGDAYVVVRTPGGVEVHHVDRDTGATTLVARDGYIDDVFTPALSAGSDGKVWLGQERESSESHPGRLVRIDPTAFAPGDPLANQELVLENALLDDLDALALLPAPAVASLALAPGWAQWLGAAALLWLGGRLRSLPHRT